MLTRWGLSLDPELPLPEHPRPQLTRPHWLSLNGRWDVAFTDGAAPSSYEAQIVVPFSPEAPLSGVGRQLQPGETLWYRRDLPAFDVPTGHRTLLHFGAVDQTCRVLLDGREVARHTGGYLPFTLDLTDHLAEGGRHELVVACQDASETGIHARGKQRLARGGIWYTAQSGIWQTVWLEDVPPTYVQHLTLVPHLAEEALDVTVEARGESPGEQPSSQTARVEVIDEGRVVASAEVPVGRPGRVAIPEPRAWSPDDPFLYDLRVILGEDEVTGYVGLRDLGISEGRFTLNGSPIFHAGVLDQGYWPDGLYTAPSDEALRSDLEAVKRMGFTMVRKHVKIEPLRWYHHADRLGLLVWQDLPNGGGHYGARVIRGRVPLSDHWHSLFGRSDAAGRQEFRDELRRTVRLLGSLTCLAVWVPFNEGWGQFDANEVAAELAELDPTRAVNQASGWQDQGGGDIDSRHEYLKKFRLPDRPGDDRLLALAEYGGLHLRVNGHSWGRKSFGYRRAASPKQLVGEFRDLHAHLAGLVDGGLSATVYTQLTDVEDELNGLLTYDREVTKVDEREVRSVIRGLTSRLR